MYKKLNAKTESLSKSTVLKLVIVATFIVTVSEDKATSKLSITINTINSLLTYKLTTIHTITLKILMNTFALLSKFD